MAGQTTRLVLSIARAVVSGKVPKPAKRCFKSLAMRWIAHPPEQDIDPIRDRTYTDWPAMR